MDARVITSIFIITQLVMVSRAEDICPNEPPVWLAGVNSVIPILGVALSFSYFIALRCCSEKHQKYYLKGFRAISLMNCIIFWVSLVILIMSCKHFIQKILNGVEGTEWVFVVAMAISWLVMMIESYVSRERWYIKHLEEKRPALRRIDKIRRTQPTVDWSVVGYNYEENTSCTKTACFTPVVKFSDNKEYVYQHWVDHTEDRVVGGCHKLITRLKLKHEIQAGDAATREDMENKKKAWKDSFRERKEAHIDFMEEPSIRGFAKRIGIDESLCCCKRTKDSSVKKTGKTNGEGQNKDCCNQCCVCLKESCTPLVIGKAQFWFFSVIALTWPYRWLFKCLTDKTYYTVEKKFYSEEPHDLEEGIGKWKYGQIVKDIGNIQMEPEPDNTKEEDTGKINDEGQTNGDGQTKGEGQTNNNNKKNSLSKDSTGHF